MIRTDALATELDLAHDVLVILTERMGLMASPVLDADPVDGMAVYELRDDAAELVRARVARRRAEAAAAEVFTKTPYALRDGVHAFDDDRR